MKLSEFVIGSDFQMAGRTYRCTDIGTRTVVGIRIDMVSVTKTNLRDPPRRRILTGKEADAEAWFKGPPYALFEKAFDENDQEVCEPANSGTVI